MSDALVDDPPRVATQAISGSVLLHALALVVVLVAGAVVVRTGELFFVDEGAVVSQTRAIDDGSWRIEHPALEVDPEGRWFPIQYSEVVDGGAAGVPYAKHPAYPVLLSWLDDVGGIPAMVAASIVGTVAAALGAAWLAATMGVSERSRVAALWICGLGTPLLFDSYLVVAHTLAAAFVTVAVIALLRVLDQRSSSVWAAAAGVAVGAGALLRTEVVLFGAALAVGSLVADATRGRRLVGAVASMAGAGSAYLLDAWLHQVVIGGSGTAPFVIRQSSGWLGDRVESLYTTVVRPGFPDQASTAALSLTILSACCAGLVALAARRARPEDRAATLVMAGGSVVLAGGAALLAPAALVPGLVAASPAVLWIVVWWRDLWRDDPRWRTVLTTVSLFVLAVLLVQYDSGGGPQWGGRYFAIAVPTLVVLGVRVAELAGSRIDRRTGLAVATSVALVMAIGSGRSLVALRDAHAINTSALAAIGDAVDDVAQSGDPLVLTTSFVPPRLGVDLVAERRWLLVPDDELADAIGAAAEAGEDDVVVVSEGLPPLPGVDERLGTVDLVEPVGGWIVLRVCQDC